MAGIPSQPGKRIGVTDSCGTGGTLFPFFLLGENLLDALLPPPAADLKPDVESCDAIAATGGEDAEILALWVTVDGLHDEVRPDADSSQDHENLYSNGPVSLDSLPLVLRFHLFYLGWSDALSLTEAWSIVKTTVQNSTLDAGRLLLSGLT